MELQTYFDKGQKPQDFRSEFNSLVEAGKTSGENQSEDIIHYTKMNLQRYERWQDHAKLDADVAQQLQNLTKPMKWIVITEVWCGDAAHAMPFLEKMAAASDKIEMRYVLRDQNPDLIDAYLTNGGRSIPIVIAFDENNKELFSWGPRPASLQDWFLEAKKEEKSFDEMVGYLQKWYNQDKGKSTQQELLQLIHANT